MALLDPALVQCCSAGAVLYCSCVLPWQLAGRFMAVTFMPGCWLGIATPCLACDEV